MTEMPVRRLLLFLVLASCEGSNPSGNYSGSLTRTYNDPAAAAKAGVEPNLGDSVVITKKNADNVRVTFGTCWIEVKRPKQTVESTWKFTGGSSCQSASGDVNLVDGELTVLDEKTTLLSATGVTTDKSVSVTYSGMLKKK